MNSEKVKEIKKKLKERYCYLDQAYSDHLAYGGKGDEQTAEEIYLLRDTIEYINEMESENERYKQSCGAIGQNGLTIINQLKERIAGLESENAIKSDTIVGLLKNQEFCEKEKLTKFAERLKEKLKEKVNAGNVDAFVECSSMIRDLLREFVEE